jgi:hypothetical protein
MQEIYEICSYDRRSGNPNNFNVQLPIAMVGKSSFKLTSVSIPLNIYNVASYNNTVTYFEYATTKSASVAPGYYTRDQLLLALASSMTLVGPDTYTCTYSNTTKTVTISKSSTFSLFLDSRSPLLELLGFVLNNTQTATAVSAVSTLAPDMYPKNLYILIRELGTSNIQSTANNSFTYYVPVVTSDSTYNNVGEEILGEQKIKTNLTSGVFNVSLVDRKMRLIELESDWSFTLSVS